MAKAGRAKERAMILSDTFPLAGGMVISKLGLHTWRIDDDAVMQVVRDALAIGDRHIDTAQAHGNERGVDEAVRAGALRGTMCSTPSSLPGNPRAMPTSGPASMARCRCSRSITST